MLRFNRQLTRIPRQWQERLKAAGIGLGLARLQMDMGLEEEAKATLACLQDDFQKLLQRLDNTMEPAPAKVNAARHGEKSPGWNEYFLAVHA